jgi:hypothetical protein
LGGWLLDSSTRKAVKNGRIVDFSYSSELVNATEILSAETFNVSQQGHLISVSSPPRAFSLASSKLCI